MTTPTQTPPCPKCGGPMFDEKNGKFPWKPGRPIFKCRNKGVCDGVIWEPRNGAAPAQAKPQGKQPVNIGGPLPGEYDEPPHPAQQGDPLCMVAGEALMEADARRDIAKGMLTLYRDCFAEALRMVKALNDDPKTVLEFTSDNVCSITSTLFIAARQQGIVRLAA